MWRRRASSLALAVLVGFAAAPSVAFQAPGASGQQRELVKEAAGGGNPRIEREVLRSGSALVNDGVYRRWHDDDALAAEGSYAQGLLSGEWSTFHESGKLRTKGAFLKGRRTGRWELFWEDGRKAAEGSYLLGLRDDRWLYWHPDGTKDEVESGLYRMKAEVYEGEGRPRRYVVETRNGVRHGRWTSYWENGERQLEGTYRAGVREGWWSFFHLDGSLEPELVSGRYVAGTRDPTAAESPPALRDSWVVPEGGERFAIAEEALAQRPPAIDLAKLPRLARAPGVKPSQRTQIQGWIGLLLAGTDEEKPKAEQVLLQYGRDATPEILNELRASDLATDEGRTRGGRLVALASAICHGLAFPWNDVASEPAFEENRRAILRWFSWWELVKSNDAWWANPPQAASRADVLLSIELLDLPSAEKASGSEPAGEGAAASERPSGLFETRARAKRDRDLVPALGAALAWLAAHQTPDGSWDGDGFPDRCGKLGEKKCEGTGEAMHDVGLSGLALLAFMGEGITSSSVPHGDVVGRGLAWLCSQQGEESGAFGDPSGGYVYDHAIATLALAEALHFDDSGELRHALERAVAWILAARNPGLAWRYAVPPDGRNDTSVTGWMVSALASAKSAGVSVDPAAFEGALTWIDRMTLRENGRVGYDSVGSRSSRVTEVNQHFPIDRGEAMTAVGLWCRFLAGQPPSTPVFARHAELLLAKPPEWDPDAFSVDMYYWYYGTCAMARMGERYWSAWSSALKKAALASQRKEKDSDARGSWDPVDPWGWSGGRIYATALMALCLEGGWRDPAAGAGGR